MGADTVDSWFVHRSIHKGLRQALFDVTGVAGRTDGHDDRAVEALEAAWRDVELTLDGHQHAEQRSYGPILAAHAPHLQDEADRLHAHADLAIDAIDTLLARLSGAPIPRRVSLLGVLHLDLADLAAAYVHHLRYEEDTVVPALNAAVAPAILAEAGAATFSSLPTDDLEVLLRLVMPSLSAPEQTMLLAVLAHQASPATFEHLRGTIDGLAAADR